jgi:hypothetical protein
MATIIAVFIAVVLGWVFGRAPSRESEMLKSVLSRIGVLQAEQAEPDQSQSKP